MEISSHIIALPHHRTSHCTDIEYYFKPGRALCDVGGKFPWIVSEGNICGSLACVPQCPPVFPVSPHELRENSQQLGILRAVSLVWQLYKRVFLHKYFHPTEVAAGLGPTIYPALHVKSLTVGTNSLLSLTTRFPLQRAGPLWVISLWNYKRWITMVNF